MLSGPTLDLAVNAITVSEVRAHQLDPGADGTAAPILGQAACNPPPSNDGTGVRTEDVDVAVSAGDTVRYYTLWDGATYRGSHDFDASAETFTNAGTARITVTLDINN